MAYLRVNDGDHELSQVEKKAFLANRETPRFDQAAVAGATVEGDLDSALVEAYLDSCRSSSASPVRLSDADILFRTGVTTGSDRAPTLAGLLALGVHPQQFAPTPSSRPVSSPRRAIRRVPGPGIRAVLMDRSR
jgi:ATP-dependent DNA helicase RecG